MKMNITNITCNSTASGALKDDVFLLIQADGMPPVRYPPIGVRPTGQGDRMELPEDGLVVDFKYGVIVTAFDRDYKILSSIFNDNDYLFNVWVNYQTASGTETKLNNNGASYTITRDISP
jgi:hypothetical protein